MDKLTIFQILSIANKHSKGWHTANMLYAEIFECQELVDFGFLKISESTKNSTNPYFQITIHGIQFIANYRS